MAEIGIIQGRLLPPFEKRIQGFPAERWRDEFTLAREAGLANIEWIFEKPNAHKNPLGNDDGAVEIMRLAEETGVAVRSLCADYYMEELLIGPEGAPLIRAVDHLRWLIDRVGKLSIRYIVLPFVDSSSLKTPAQLEGLVSLLTRLASAAEDAGVELHLETDLRPETFRGVLEQIAHPFVRANYDIGNSASIGYDPEQELSLLRPFLGSVHVKDRALGGVTVPLGTGNANFPICFRMIVEAGFQGPYVLQAARGKEGDEVSLAIANRQFIEGHLAAFERA
jgi:L-ribulose-5-phosphate 3-epimerase